jgi:hypothetical protein
MNSYRITYQLRARPSATLKIGLAEPDQYPPAEEFLTEPFK